MSADQMYVDGAVSEAEESPQSDNTVAFAYSDAPTSEKLDDPATQPSTPIEYEYRDQEPSPFHESAPAEPED